MKYLSVCSGIEAATVAWHSLGWQPVGFSEIEPFPSAVLAHHYPGVPNLGDMTKYKEWNIGPIDLLVGGTPCQSFSVAGLRKGLEDPRGNLALVYCGILDHFRPQWCVWENVPGVLSSNGGRDFGSFLGALAELGYGFAYRVLDAQYFGVAQRRRRVFVVGYLGDWHPAAKILFESESLRRDNPPSREKREGATPSPVPGVANCLTNRMHKGINTTVDEGQTPIIAVQPGMKQTTYVAQAIPLDLRNAGRDPEKHDEMNRQGVGVGNLDDPSHTLTSACVHGVAVDVYNQVIDGQTAATLTEACGGTNTSGPKIMQPVAPTLTASNDPSRSPQSTEVTNQVAAVHAASMAVRRLTPVECERLQGFPDGYTDIKPKGKDTPDGPRYKALGNSMAVPVMRWIGERIS